VGNAGGRIGDDFDAFDDDALLIEFNCCVRGAESDTIDALFSLLLIAFDAIERTSSGDGFALQKQEKEKEKSTRVFNKNNKATRNVCGEKLERGVIANN
jgi:hypothetical protein